MTGVPGAEAALAPVRDALLARARERAADVRADAEREAAATLAAARREAARILDEARAAGRADGAAAGAAERSRTRNQARTVVLAARRRAYDELCRQVRAEMRALCAGAGGPETVRRLKATARRRLGPAARTAEAPGGGLVARTAHAELDLSADVLAERAVAALGAEVARLWDTR
ncbi:V-type ATP synthase subunit E family protein [Actinomadura chibensis]|uniref:ATP synthase F0 subunit B n=1 Tax=Actinomadura chibensis TaxID=392828 RepID=A0A5D0N738_9ACTN|nr:V-type ATP synthase subunit E family protein [Actinomadura chibensis]TYB40146.1 hypothetical protein FXF69_39865 [Actinomadura chibensis]